MARNSSRAFRKTAQLVVARDGGICGLCGHSGAITVDHIISYANWPKNPDGTPWPGLDSMDNLRPAHGTRGVAPPNPCPTCRRLCNQSRGAGNQKTAQPENHSRNW